MDNDFKKGFSIGAGVLVAMLIPTGIYFLSSYISKKIELNKEYSTYVEVCTEAHLGDYKKGFGILIENNVDEANQESYSKRYCKKNDEPFWSYWKQQKLKK